MFCPDFLQYEGVKNLFRLKHKKKFHIATSKACKRILLSWFGVHIWCLQFIQRHWWSVAHKLERIPQVITGLCVSPNSDDSSSSLLARSTQGLSKHKRSIYFNAISQLSHNVPSLTGGALQREINLSILRERSLATKRTSVQGTELCTDRKPINHLQDCLLINGRPSTFWHFYCR